MQRAPGPLHVLRRLLSAERFQLAPSVPAPPAIAPAEGFKSNLSMTPLLLAVFHSPQPSALRQRGTIFFKAVLDSRSVVLQLALVR